MSKIIMRYFVGKKMRNVKYNLKNIFKKYEYNLIIKVWCGMVCESRVGTWVPCC